MCAKLQRVNHGSVHLLLLWAFYCSFNLCHTSLAQDDGCNWDSNDKRNLNYIQNDIRYNIMPDMDRIGTAIEDAFNGGTGAFWDYVSGVGTVYVGSQGWRNLISGRAVGKDVHGNPIPTGGSFGASMYEFLMMIADSLGCLHNQAFIPSSERINLMQSILGWTHMGYEIKTNGVLGRIRHVEDLLEENQDRDENFQSNLLVKIDDVVATLHEQAWLQTNQIYQMAGPQINLTDDSDRTYNIDNFISYWKKKRSLQAVDKFPYGMMLYYLPLYLTPQEEYPENFSIQYPHWSISDELASSFYRLYGNLSSAENMEPDEYAAQQSRETASSLTNEYTQSSRSTNNWTLLSLLQIPDLETPIDDLNEINNEYRREKGPSHQQLMRFAGYFESCFEDTQDSPSFSFELSIDTPSGDTVGISTGPRDLFADSSSLDGVRNGLNDAISFVVLVVKGLLLLILAYRSIEFTMNLLSGNGPTA